MNQRRLCHNLDLSPNSVKQFTGKSADELKAAKKYVKDAQARAKAYKKVDDTRAPADDLLNELTEEVKQKTTLPVPAKKKDGGV